MIRVKLPFGGITPEQMEAFADVVEKYVPLRKGHVTTRQNIQMHHIPLPEAEKAIRELGEAGLSSREGCGNTVRNVTGDPWAGVAKDELFDLTPYAGAYVRYFVRHPTTQAMPRKIKTAFDGSAAGPRDQRHPRHRLPRARARDRRPPARCAACEMLVGGGTSIMPRVAPVLYEFVELDNGEYLKITEAVLRIFDRQEWLRVNRARARIKVFVDKYGIDELRRQVEEELQGDWVAERDFSIEQRLFLDDEREAAPAPPQSYGSPNGDLSEFERFRAANVREQKQDGFVTVEVKITARRPHARAVPGPGGDHARATRAATRARPSSRTWCCAGCARRACTTSGGRCRELGPRRRRLARDQRRGVLPGHRLVQARDHELDGPQRGRAGADRSDGHHRPADAPDPHQDQRLPERLRPAPRRQHRLLRRVDQGRRAHDPRLHPPRRRRLRRRRGRSSARA